MDIASHRHRPEHPRQEKRDKATLNAPQKRIVRNRRQLFKVERKECLHSPNDKREQQTSGISLHVQPARTIGNQTNPAPLLKEVPL